MTANQYEPYVKQELYDVKSYRDNKEKITTLLSYSIEEILAIEETNQSIFIRNQQLDKTIREEEQNKINKLKATLEDIGIKYKYNSSRTTKRKAWYKNILLEIQTHHSYCASIYDITGCRSLLELYNQVQIYNNQKKKGQKILEEAKKVLLIDDISDLDLIEKATNQVKSKWLLENYKEGQECLLDDNYCECEKWFYGEHRCSCGNRRISFTVEGALDDIQSFYLKVEPY
ncbi:MAG: hypothetical protein ACRCXZ_06920 [Patescibacteria group bacterium]